MKRRNRIIVIAFCISFITVSALSFFSLRQFEFLTGYSDWVDHTNKVIIQLAGIAQNIRELDAQEKEFLITNDSTYINTYTYKYKSVVSDINYLQKLVIDNPTQQKTITMLKTTLALRLFNFKKNTGYYGPNSNSSLQAYNQNKSTRDASFKYINQMMKLEKVSLQERFKNRNNFQNITFSTFSNLLAIFFILTIILFLLIIYELRKRRLYEYRLLDNNINLQNSHSEIEQIAFISSHTFKESLRKIKIFGDRLLWLQQHSADVETKKTIEKINQTASTMQNFSDEIINLATLVGEADYNEAVSISHVVESLLIEYKEQIVSNNIVITYEALPEIIGNTTQLHLLFKHLFENAFKFRKTNTPLEIAIHYTKVKGDEIKGLNAVLYDKKYHCIEISDNGIGFEEVFAEKIFKVFQKLHPSTLYKGNGIGLAIVKRIMINHHGIIIANSSIGEGSIFKLYFPAN